MLGIKKRNEVISMAVDMIKRGVNEDKGKINCVEIVNGRRWKLPGYTLHMYDEAGKHKYRTIL